MARRPARRSGSGPERIEKLDPATESRETPREASKRRSQDGYRQAKRKADRRKRAILGCLGAVALAALVVATVVAVYLVGVQRRIDIGDLSPLDPTDKSVPRTVKDPFWMIIVGIDAREGETRARSDTILLTRVDPNKKRVTVVSIPRDTRARIEGHGTNKINAALSYEGHEGLINSVEDLTGTEVTEYVAVDFNGFKEIVDAMGGVWVDVPEKIVDKKASGYDYSAFAIDPGMQKLDGAHALTFVRSRNFPEGDIARIRNQQVFLKALGKQMLSLGNVFNATGIINAVADNSEMSLKISDLMSLTADLLKMEEDSVETVTLPGEPKYVGNASYVIPDDEEIETLIARIEAGESIVPSASVEASGAIKPSQVTLTVRNGVGVAGLATDASDELEKAGFRIQEIGNAGQFVYDRTLIVYAVDKRKAAIVRDAMGTGDIVESRGMYAFKTDVLVVVGKDWRSSSAGVDDSD